MIRYIYTGKDIEAAKQFREIERNQFANVKEVTLTFTGANEEVKGDVGFYCTKWTLIDLNANITFWRTQSDQRYIYFEASGAGSITLKCHRGGT